MTLTSEAAREYRIGTGAWTPYSAPVRFATDGVFRLDYRARKDGLPSAGRSLELKVDQTVPATTAVLDGVTSGGTFTGAVRLTLAATDATSGVARTEWRLAGESAQAYTAAVTLPAAAGERTIEYRSLDAAGNAEPWKRASFSLTERHRAAGRARMAGSERRGARERSRAVPRGRGRPRAGGLRGRDGAVAQRHHRGRHGERVHGHDRRSAPRPTAARPGRSKRPTRPTRAPATTCR